MLFWWLRGASILASCVELLVAAFADHGALRAQPCADSTGQLQLQMLSSVLCSGTAAEYLLVIGPLQHVDVEPWITSSADLYHLCMLGSTAGLLQFLFLLDLTAEGI